MECGSEIKVKALIAQVGLLAIDDSFEQWVYRKILSLPKPYTLLVGYNYNL